MKWYDVIAQVSQYICTGNFDFVGYYIDHVRGFSYYFCENAQECDYLEEV